MLITSCCDDDGIQEFEFPDCSVGDDLVDNTTDRCSNYLWDSTEFCEIIVVNEHYLLPMNHREWMPYYCLNVGDAIPYINSVNEETYLVVENLDRGLYSGGFNGFDDCGLNDGRHRIYCVNWEIMSTQLSSELLGHDFQIKLEVEFNRPFEIPLRTGAILNIRGNNISHFTAFVEPGDLENIQAENFIFDEEIELLGEVFLDVHTFKNVVQDSFVQFYYNKEFGVIGFVDYNNELWKLKK